MNATAIVLAAGEGTRMKSNHAKVSHQILGKPMIRWVVDATIAAGCERVVVVVGSHADEVRAILADAYADSPVSVETVEQTERLGTGHAVRVALEATGISDGPVVVLNGDLPLIQADTVRLFAETVATGELAATVLTMTPPDPFGYGRIQLDADGAVERIIEQKDCTPEQDAELLECNAGCYAFDGALLAAHIGEVTNDNAQAEYYLPDMLEILKRHGHAVSIFHCEDYRDGLGVNSRVQLAELTAIARDRINERLMTEGVTFIDPAQAWIGPDATIGRDTVVWPQTHLIGTCSVGESCQLGPNTRLTNTRAGNGCVIDETIAVDAVLENDVECGPRAYLRPGTHMLDGSKAGTHVEIKKSTIGEGSKVPHLSYIGDTTMGAGVNVGAGSITCNYDGKNKHATVIGDRTFIGSDTMMVAPVRIGSDAITGAGGTITKDVPDGALALERTDQRVLEGYTERRRARL
ncbi:UDP-N-acetylglucosamine diphosphorylase/glucosamine-1-phosphate N-acetyltransferase [Collinsella sp. BA40]|uniref:bifunctional UDP-N-acetylglucosamine diphosphorylase/glucosamine-1-phosphate N-acetyltransferase GlmU n=1 Tax=Collinsella sp. BA40 TaxID=2560852 RepID=UPI0011CA8B36|nr:bifunctional UDP-N-acetylglucosamine diphosphorylase/glucosamine-1-phosphate N-acetyltransferase GlmU [Collinsella sp. BA40]TXF38554.1 UDP-N-acetylglucosamine diphosphorylase/glucosamine-1-phosphate N-acetyltransferase [Collinsella sp. BA40]